MKLDKSPKEMEVESGTMELGKKMTFSDPGDSSTSTV
jgi:hypothetical protein